MAGTVIYKAHPAMFRAHPFWFIGCKSSFRCSASASSAALLVHPHAADCAYLTDSELLYERGILSKDRTSVSVKHVCAVHVTQGFLNRILGVGTIQISTAGDQPEFTVADMPDPGTIREAISKAQNQGAD